MRVAMVTPSYPPDRCAIGHFSSLLSAEIARLGHEVFILGPVASGSRRGEGGGEDPRQVAGQKACLVPRARRDWSRARSRQLWEQVAALRPDVVNLQFVPNLYGRYGISLGPVRLARWARDAGIRLVATLHELSMPWSLAPREMAVAAVQRLQLAALIHQASATVVTTEHRLQKLRCWLPFKRHAMALVPIGANVLPGDQEWDASPLETGAEDELQLTFFGSMHPSKQPDVALRSLVGLLEDGVRARLVFVGSEDAEVAPWLARLTSNQRALVRDAVICTGWVSSEEVTRLLGTTDIFLLPLVDGVSTLRGSFMAALAHRLAIVSTLGRETSRELADSGAAELAQAGRAGEFVASVRALAADPSRRGTLRARAGSLYESCFTWRSIAEATLALYGFKKETEPGGLPRKQGGRVGGGSVADV